MPTLEQSTMNNISLENQALEYFRQGNYTESIALYEQCIEHNPERTEYYYYLGLNYFLLGEEEEAQDTWMSLLMTDNPEEIETEISNLVKFLEQEILRQLEKNNVAIGKKIYDKILEIEPNYSNHSLDFKAKIPFLYGKIPELAKARTFQEVIELLKLILQLDDTFASGWHDLAVTYYQIQEYNLGLDAINKAIELSPLQALYHYNAGLILTALGNNYLAIEAYTNAIKLDAKLVNAYNNIANIFVKLGNLEEGKSIYLKALTANPNHFGTALNLFDTLSKLGQTQESQNFLREREKLFPDELLWKIVRKLELPAIYNNKKEIEFYRQKFSDGLEEISEQLDLGTTAKKNQALIAIGYHNNFYLPYQNYNDLELQKTYGQIVSKIVKENYPEWCGKIHLPKLPIKPKIKIGYISAQFINHPGTKWLLGWLNQLNKQEFENYCYHLGSKIDSVTDEFRASSDFFNHINGNLEAVGQQILKDKLHILIYTDLGMDACSIPLAAMRLAPIQCNTWGHPVTSGLPTIDYFLSGALIEPENAQEHYSEKLICLPNIGFYHSQIKLPNQQKTRSELEIPEDRIIYVCCQTLFKYLPQHDYIFPSIAQRVKSAQFVFAQWKSLTSQFQRRLKESFTQFGLNSEDFCLFLPRVNFEDYLNRNLVSDIYLDTIGFSGANTALHAVACHLPIVTYAGEFMRGRLAYGILKMIGVEDTIAYSEQEYIDIAVRLALDSQWRASIVQKIKTNQDRVFEDKTCVRALENFFKQVVRVDCNEQ